MLGLRGNLCWRGEHRNAREPRETGERSEPPQQRFVEVGELSALKLKGLDSRGRT